MKVFLESRYFRDILPIETETATVIDVKQKVQETKGLPVGYQLLIFEGQILENDQELAHYNIGENATLYLATDHHNAGYSYRELKRLANYHLVFKKICRKCYGQLSPNATRCRKVKCGRTTNIRYKKPLFKSDPAEYKGFRL